jgi:hypothetical protein
MSGRREILVSDEASASVMILDLVFRAEDVTVWFGHRTLAVIALDALRAWLQGEGDLTVDDLVWSGRKGARTLTVDGHRTYGLDAECLEALRQGAQAAQSERH